MESINGFQKMYAKTLAAMMIGPQCRLCSDTGGGLGEIRAWKGADCGNEDDAWCLLSALTRGSSSCDSRRGGQDCSAAEVAVEGGEDE
jgi:hypothetical protein